MFFAQRHWCKPNWSRIFLPQVAYVQAHIQAFSVVIEETVRCIYAAKVFWGFPSNTSKQTAFSAPQKPSASSMLHVQMQQQLHV